MSSLSAVLALTFALASGAASAQEPATQTPARPSAQLEDVVVEGRQLEALVADFVSEIAQPANNRGLARWNRAVCVGAVNLRGDVARYVGRPRERTGLPPQYPHRRNGGRRDPGLDSRCGSAADV
ncbi:MAG: Uncharacterized protein FD125_1098 [bacterium]|nr:MAG: Uncharacterized protein FD125_1098 [bacterium]